MGITSSSEDSSELWFLLVENYNYLTAPVGLRIGWESLEKNILCSIFSLFVLLARACREEIPQTFYPAPTT